MVLETGLQLAENTHYLYAMIPGQTSSSSSYYTLTSAETKFRFVPQQETIQNPGSRGNNRYAEELRLHDPYHNPQSCELVNHIGMDRPIAMKREPSPATMEVSWSTEQTHASQPRIQLTPRNDHSEESIPIVQRKRSDILAYKNYKGNTFEAAVSKLAMKLVRHMIKKNEKLMVQFIGRRWVQSCCSRFREETDTFGSRTLVTISLMCKQQTSESHSSTESEVKSLDAGLRMDGTLALDLWDVVIEVLRSSKSTESPTMRQQETVATSQIQPPPKIEQALAKALVVSDSDWLHHVYKGSNKTRFQWSHFRFAPFRDTLVGRSPP